MDSLEAIAVALRSLSPSDKPSANQYQSRSYRIQLKASRIRDATAAVSRMQAKARDPEAVPLVCS